MISPEDPVERDMILFLIENIQKKLSISINNGYGIKRYENDTYIDGNPWIETTLWLSEAMFAFALDLPEEQGTSMLRRQKADREGIKCSDGLLPELQVRAFSLNRWISLQASRRGHPYRLERGSYA
jgi:GH15 family glucan-1,4-alpha-glucosidase